MRVILVGRHTSGEMPGVEVVEQRSVTFPATSEECTKVLLALFADANEANAGVLFQNMPGQVAVALCGLSMIRGFRTDEEVGFPRRSVGVIISVPGPRPGRVSREFGVDYGDTRVIEDAVRFANPRAEVEHKDMGVTVTVDGPPSPFMFSHIEWLD